MTLVSGPLSTVTTDPTAVSVVQVSVQGPRTAGTGVQTHESKNVAVSGGVFSHEIAPGPATLTMIVGQQPGPPIPILVDDVESQTLADVVDAARLASGETQESLAQLVQQALTARTEVLDAVEDLVAEKGVALSAISDARGGALTDIDQATSSAIVDIGTAESGALSAIGVEVGEAEGAADRAEDAADRAENAVNDGVGDGSVTVAKLAQDVKDQINSKADLVGGKVPTSQIPEVALTKPFSVTSRAGLLALDAQEGDIGIITAGVDKGSYMLGTGPANVFSSWIQLAVSADAPVQSVNGQTGTVVLSAENVGASPTGHKHTKADITDLPTTDGGYNTQDATDAPSAYPVGVSVSMNNATYKGWAAVIGEASLPTLGTFVVVTTMRQAGYENSTWQYLHSYTLPGASIYVRKWQDSAWSTLRRITDDVVRQEVTGTNGDTIFEKRGNVVHVASTGTEAGVTIPTDFRPTQARRVVVSTSSTGATSVGVCTLNTNGSILGSWAANSAFSYLAQ